MKIGIITIHHVTNYGAVWQAYALATHVASLGHAVEVIDYRPPVAVKYYRERIGQRGQFNVKRTVLGMLFQQFVRRRIQLGTSLCSNRTQLYDASKHYEAIIAGSDQIWCTGEGSFRGYDSNFFLDFCENPQVRKISYAASAGNTKDFGEYATAITESLQTFSAIGVRDEPTFHLVKRTCNVTADIVLDPVFLHDFEEIVGDVQQTDDLIIFADNPKPFEAIAADVAARWKLRIVAIKNRCRYADKNLRVVSPVKWLRLMKGARVVMTDYFHGMAVSLKFGRPLIVNAPATKSTKIEDLINRLGLPQILVADNQRAREFLETALKDPEMHAATVNRRLKDHIEFSKKFIIRSLS